MSWVWLSPPQIEFGGTAPAGDGAEQAVWVHADPFALLAVPPGSDPDSLRRAYRRLARVHHPDTGKPDGTFEQLQHAFRSALGHDASDVTVEPTAGAWW